MELHLLENHCKKLLEDYQVHHNKSTRYYPQGNGVAEAFNKLLIRVLSQTVHENPELWHEYVPLELWAYRTSRRGATRFTPFSLVYDSEAILPVETMIPSTRLGLMSGLDVDQSKLADLEVVEEKRNQANQKIKIY